MKENRQQPIAIVAIGALFPGAKEKNVFWKNILDGRDLITDVPPDRWLIEDYFAENSSAGAKTYCKRGGFIPDVEFDPMEFGMPPKLLSSTDVSQLLSLIVAKQIMEEAHCTQFEKVNRDRISIILGASAATQLVSQMASKIQQPVWQKALRESGIPENQVQDICEKIYNSYPDWDENTFPGLLGNVIAGRIANRLNICGTNCTVDAACGSSFAAINMAIQELQLGNSDLLITGGVDALNDIFMYMCFTKTSAISRSGDCRPFSKDADGTLIGEGIGMIALRRLEDAEKDGDKIYAVIRGIGTSSDGKGKSVYAPSPDGQAKAILKAYAHARYGMDQLELLEAHGTATAAGDVAEFEGLCKAMARFYQGNKRLCALGSVKSQIGHTKAAAGSASLIKTVMALHHKVLPVTIKVEKPNPKFHIEDSPYYLNTMTRPWIHKKSSTRKAGVSAFGFGGSNFHLTVEEYVGKGSKPKRIYHANTYLLLFCAHNVIQLLNSINQIIQNTDNTNHETVSRNLQLQFDATFEKRLAVLIADQQDIQTVLKTVLEKVSTSPEKDLIINGKYYYCTGDSIVTGESISGESSGKKLGILFPGQGSQYLNMGADLAIQFNEVREAWDLAAEIEFDADNDLHQVVFPNPVFSEEERKQQGELLRKTQWAQPALGTMSVSLMKLLNELGIEADCFAGHSFGEITALYAAGVISNYEDFLKISRKRGELMAEDSIEDGAMTAVLSDEQVIKEILLEINNGIVIANYNSPAQNVISGATKEIERVETILTRRGISFKRLPVATAFHSHIVGKSAEPFYEFIKSMDFRQSPKKVLSNSSGDVYASDTEELKRVLGKQLAKPVLFRQQIEKMYEMGIRIFLEVGPGAVLTKLVGDCLKDRPHMAIAMDKNGQNGIVSFWNALGLLSAIGIPVSYRKLWDEFEKPLENLEKKFSKTMVKINGASYGKPYPSPNGTADLPLPNSEIVVKDNKWFEISRIEKTLPNGEIRERDIMNTKNDEFKYQKELQNEGEARLNNKVNHQSQEKHNYVANSNDEFLKALQIFQQQTFDEHRDFRKILVESHERFFETSKEVLRMIERVCGNNSELSLRPQNREAVRTNLPAKEILGNDRTIEIPQFRNTYQNENIPLETQIQYEQPNVDLKPPSTDFNKLLLKIVSDKTGYPEDMLDLNMELETELGIDSIKRVEIFSALMAEAPELQGIESSKIAGMKTLAEIGVYIKAYPVKSDEEQNVAEVVVAIPVVNGNGVVQESDFKNILLDVVAEKTGYPNEMLDLGMEMETELGIDSIKRVEIISALISKVPELSNMDNSKLATLKTLQQILDYCFEGLGQNEGQAKKKKLIRCEELKSPRGLRYIPRVVPSKAVGIAMRGLFHAHKLYIVKDQRGIGEKLAELFNVAGVPTFLTDRTPIDAISIIFLKGLDVMLTDTFEKHLKINEEAFIAAKICGNNLVNNREKYGLFVTVQNTGGDFGFHGNLEGGIWGAGLSALAKTAAQEWKNASVKAIDIECTAKGSAEIARGIFLEIIQGGTDLEVGLTSYGQRITIGMEYVPETKEKFELQEGDVVLVSGGARGITAECIGELAKTKKLKIAIFGRTELSDEPQFLDELSTEAELMKVLLEKYNSEGMKITPTNLLTEVKNLLANREIGKNISSIKSNGSEVEYFRVDINDFEKVKDIVDQIRARWGSIKGIVHAAGILADKHIHHKTEEQFRKVFSTKVSGLYNLLGATKKDTLTHICCFSSVAARYGNVGQVDYSMANEVLNKVSQKIYRQKGGSCLVKSINWGPWDGGMVTPLLKDHFETNGISLIPLKQGAKYFVDELSNKGSEVEVIIGSPILKQDRKGIRGEYVLRLHKDTHAFIESHMIKGKPVVPAVFINEMFYSIAKTLYPNEVVAKSRNFKVLKGIVLEHFYEKGEWLIISYEVKKEKDQKVIAFNVIGASGIKHYYAEVIMLAKAEKLQNPAYPKSMLDLKPWYWDPKEVYDGKLFHSNEFKVIKELTGICESGCSGVLFKEKRLTVSKDDFGFNSAIFDGSLQVAYLWKMFYKNTKILPTAFNEFYWYRDIPYQTDILTEIVQIAENEFSSSFNIVLMSPERELYAEIKGAETFYINF